MGWLSGIGSAVAGLFSGGNIAEKAAQTAQTYIEQPAERDRVVARIVEAEAERAKTQTVPVLDGLHKLGRQGLWIGMVVVFLVYRDGPDPLTVQEFGALAAGPGLYTALKGRGR